MNGTPDPAASVAAGSRSDPHPANAPVYRPGRGSEGSGLTPPRIRIGVSDRTPPTAPQAKKMQI